MESRVRHETRFHPLSETDARERDQHDHDGRRKNERDCAKRLVQSPAVGGLTVNFTHSFLTTYWLKTGLCGLALALLYLARLGRMLASIAPRRPLLAGAMAGPLLIDVTLYASFKSLDFGLVLLLIALWAPELRGVAVSGIFSPQSHEGHKVHEED